MPDIAGLQDALNRLESVTLPKLETQVDRIIDRTDKIVDEDVAALMLQVSNVLRGVLEGAQAIVNSLPARASEVLGAPNLRALLDEYEVRISLAKKDSEGRML
jgi:hypothetical protein